jgi:MFS transporter, DHA1 family, inner membrane transport protein
MPSEPPHVREKSIPMSALVWLFGAGSASACVASVEVGAVALALRHKLAPSAAFLFTVPLCIGSVLGGVWVSIRNRGLRQRSVVGMVLLTVVGTLAVAWDLWLGSAIAGAVLIGLFLAPLGTSFSLSLDDVFHPTRRAERFALLRTSKSVGVIVASSVMAFVSLEASILASATLAFVSAILIGAVHARRADRRSPAGRQDAAASQRS